MRIYNTVASTSASDPFGRYVITDPEWGSGTLAVDGTADWSERFYTMQAAAPLGSDLCIPGGIYGTTVPWDVLGTNRLVGEGFVFNQFTAVDDLEFGSIIVPLNAMPNTAGTHHAANPSSEGAGVVRTYGTAFPNNGNVSSSTADKTGGGICRIAVDGRGIANCFQTLGRRANLEQCSAYNPLKNTYLLTGQNTWMMRCIASCADVASSNAVYNEGHDNKIKHCELRNFAVGVQHSVLGLAAEISDCHIYSGLAGSNAIKITSNSKAFGQFKFTNNQIDNVEGHCIVLLMTGNADIRGVNITGNHFFHNGNFSGSPSLVYIDQSNAGAACRVNFTGNTADNADIAGGNFNALVERRSSGVAGSATVVMSGNIGMSTSKCFDGTGFRPSQAGNNVTVSQAGSVTRSDNGGASTQSGNGSTTSFTIAHGLGFTPNHWVVNPASSAAKGERYVTADSTNLTVVFTAAPASGTNNLSLTWKAWA